MPDIDELLRGAQDANCRQARRRTVERDAVTVIPAAAVRRGGGGETTTTAVPLRADGAQVAP